MRHAGGMLRSLIGCGFVVMATLVPSAWAGEIADMYAALAGHVGAAAAGAAVGEGAAPGSEAAGEAGPLAPPVTGTSLRPLTPLPTVPEVPAIERIGLERTPCFAGCPAFTLVIEQDGRFRYVGEQRVERLGEHRGSIDLGTLRLIFRYVDEIGFLALDDRYLSGFLDGPTSYTMVVWGGVTKIVLNDANAAPARVWALEKLIEMALDGARWDE